MQCCTATASGLSNNATIWLIQPISIQQGTDAIYIWKSLFMTKSQVWFLIHQGNSNHDIYKHLLYGNTSSQSVFLWRINLLRIIDISWLYQRRKEPRPHMNFGLKTLTSFVMRSIASEG